MCVASFPFASANKYETADNVEGNDVILTEACGCPLHVLEQKVGVGTTHTHTQICFVFGDPQFKSSPKPTNVTYFILFHFISFGGVLIPPNANSGTVPQISHDHFIPSDFQI